MQTFHPVQIELPQVGNKKHRYLRKFGGFQLEPFRKKIISALALQKLVTKAIHPQSTLSREILGNQHVLNNSFQIIPPVRVKTWA